MPSDDATVIWPVPVQLTAQQQDRAELTAQCDDQANPPAGRRRGRSVCAVGAASFAAVVGATIVLFIVVVGAILTAKHIIGDAGIRSSSTLAPATATARPVAQDMSTTPSASPGPSTTVGTTTEPVASTRGPTTTPTADACHTFYARLNVHPEQAFAGLVDGDAWGTSLMILCTSLPATANFTLRSVRRSLIASHIHFVDSEEEDGSDGVGPPVISFCGLDGRLDPEVSYDRRCAAAIGGVSRNAGVGGLLVEKYSEGMGLRERVLHIVQHPEQYYLSFHSAETAVKWGTEGCWTRGGGCRGLLRGQLQRRQAA